MSGGGGGPIILKLVKDALNVSIVPSGKYKIKHALYVTHAFAFLAGLVVRGLVG